MRAAVQDVHHRGGQHRGVHAAQIAIQRNPQRIRRSARRRHGHGENRVRTQTAFVFCAIQRDHGRVQQPLIGGIHTGQFRSENALDVLDCLQNALAEIVALVAVAQFHGFVFARRRATGNGCPSNRTTCQYYIGLNRRITARIENFPRTNCSNFRHSAPRNVVLKSVFELRPPIHSNRFASDRADGFQKGHRRPSASVGMQSSTRDSNKAAGSPS